VAKIATEVGFGMGPFIVGGIKSRRAFANLIDR
jgi:hypothetical protein